jgi:hypothetical protein
MQLHAGVRYAALGSAPLGHGRKAPITYRELATQLKQQVKRASSTATHWRSTIENTFSAHKKGKHLVYLCLHFVCNERCKHSLKAT